MKHPSTILVECSACGGSGKVAMPYAYRKTLELLGTKPPNRTGWWLSIEVAKRLGIGRSAACNRLAWLVQHGLAERADFGYRDQRWRPRYEGIAVAL